MFDIYIVYSDLKDLEKLKKINSPESFFIHGLNINTKDDRSSAFKLKKEWGAKKDPFIIVKFNDIPIKCFYSDANYEVGDDVIVQLINFLNENKNQSLFRLPPEDNR